MIEPPEVPIRVGARPEVTKHEGQRGAKEPGGGEDVGQAADFQRLMTMMDEQNVRGARLSRGTLEVLGAGSVAAILFVSTAVGNGLFGPGSAAERLGWVGGSESPKVHQDLALPSGAQLDADGADRVGALDNPDTVLPASVARAATVVFANGRQVGRGAAYDVHLTASVRRALRSVGVDVPPSSASAAVREASMVRGLGLLVEELGSLEAALTCLKVERDLVETALELARGSNLPHPKRFESFARYLPHAARRKAQGTTRRVMALAIGYDMQWPAPEVARVSSGFGPRIHPVLGEPMMHYGTDLALEEGTAVRAMASGHVLYSRTDAVNGKFVKIDHGYGLTSAYVHNSKLLVDDGEWVKKGQLIALSGATGRATGPHLHFQVEIDNQPVDAEAFRERKAPRAHRESIEAEAIGDALIPR